ncbi:hypothetical protein Tco_0621516 [Tanacetum coccineum]
MDITRDQQLALDDALVAPANRLKIGKSNLRLSSDLNSKEATLQVVYDVLKLTPFYKAFQITADVPKIYMQEFWTTAIVHHHSIRFKMNNKKHIVNLEYFREMLQICPKLPDQQFEELLLTFLIDLDSESYKEYYTIASGVEPPKTKASVKKKQARSDKAPKAPKGSLTQFHSSHANGSGANEGTGVTPGVPDVSKYGSDDEKISWKSSSDEDDDAENENDDDDDDADNQDDGLEYDVQDDENQDDDNEQTDSDNDGDDFVHPKFSTHDEEDKEEDSFDPRVQTCSHVESTDDEDNDEERQQPSSAVSIGNRFKTCSNPVQIPGNNSIFNLNTESTSLVDVPVTTIAEPPLLSATILPPPPTPLITHLQQTPVPTPATVPRSSLQDLPNFVSSIPCVIDAYLGNKMHEAIKTNVQLNKLDNNIKKIIKDQVKEQVKAQVSKILPKIEKTVNEQLEAEVLTRSSNESKTSHAVAANLSELELKKILIDKMESNKSIHRSDEQKNLYKALVDAYESDKLILDTYGDTVSFKRRRDDEDKDEEPSAGSNRGSKRRRAGKEPESTSAPKEKTSKTIGKSTEGSKSHHKSADKSAQIEEPMHTAEDLEEPAHQEFVTGDTEDKPDEETSQHPDWFQKLAKPPTPDRDWNKTLPAAHGPVQPWLSTLAQKEDTRESFNELMDTPLDFSAFIMNRLKATTDQLDWNNPEGQQYPHDLRKPLPLIPNSRDVYSKRRIIAMIKLQIVEWHNYKHLDWITVHRDDDKLYTFKGGDFNRLRIQDI